MEAWVPTDAAPPHHTGHFFNILLHFRPLHWLDFSSVRVDAPINSSRQLIRLVPVDQEQFSFWLAAKALRSLIALVYVRPWTPSRHSTQVMCPELKRATLGFSGRLLIPFIQSRRCQRSIAASRQLRQSVFVSAGKPSLSH